MTNEELSFLFNKYLNRNYTNHEVRIHGGKTVEELEHQILHCKEYLNLPAKKTNLNDLKIAFLLSGHIRKNSILDGIIKFCESENHHVFIHTWDNIGLKDHSPQQETLLNDEVTPTTVISEINKYINLKKFEIENNKDWVESQEITHNYFNFSSEEVFIKSQLYSVNKSYKLMKEYSKENNIEYDVVIKLRFDCDMTVFNLTDKTISDIKNYNIIFAPNSDNEHGHIDYGTSCWACDNMYYKHNRKLVHNFDHTNIICDLYAYGSQKSMAKYCDLYNNYDRLNNLFYEENLKQFKTVSTNTFFENENYYLKGHEGHVDSLYYYNCKHFGSLVAYKITLYKFISSLIKMIIAILFLKKEKYLIHRYRLLGLINAYQGKNSWLRPS